MDMLLRLRTWTMRMIFRSYDVIATQSSSAIPWTLSVCLRSFLDIVYLVFICIYTIDKIVLFCLCIRNRTFA